MARSLYTVDESPTLNGNPSLDSTSKRSIRPAIFLVSFLACLAAGLYFNFQRPPVYQSSASLLTVAPPGIDQQVAEADLQHVAIQRQKLLSKPLLDKVVRRIKEELTTTESADFTVHDIQPMLAVEPVPETNLVELRAEGSDAQFLPRLVNTLLKIYLDERAGEIHQVSVSTTDALREQYQELGKKIESKREALDQFRRNNEILSFGRDENQVLARLNGLTASLNSASEEEVKAKAKLDAIRASVARGEAVVQDEDKRTLAQMEKRAQEMREELAELYRRYTHSYLQLDPKMKVLPEQLQKLERKIQQQHNSGRDIVTTSAQQEYAAASQSVRELSRQLDEHKRKATEFTARFAEHEALQEDLVRLEELYRNTEERLVQIDVENRQKYPQVKVVDWAFQPSEPISPPYLRDAGIVVLASVGLALFMVWLVEFLRPSPPEDSLATLNGIAIYPHRERLAVEQESPASLLEAVVAPLLEGPRIRELTLDELETLFASADRRTRQLVVLLLSGFSAEDILSLRGEDMGHGVITVRGDPSRVIRIPPFGSGLFEQNDTPFPLVRADGVKSPDLEELDAQLQLAAVDAGLQDSDQITCKALNHTYICYLIRQGVRFSELEQIVGNISPKVLFGYRGISPAGPGKSLDEITTSYPLLA